MDKLKYFQIGNTFIGMENMIPADGNSKIEFGDYEQREPVLKILPSKSKIVMFFLRMIILSVTFKIKTQHF